MALAALVVETGRGRGGEEKRGHSAVGHVRIKWGKEPPGTPWITKRNEGTLTGVLLWGGAN